MNNLLDQWEAEATCTIPDCDCETVWNKKIKVLVELVRKKDEALKEIKFLTKDHPEDVWLEANTALALTVEDLK